MKTYILKLTTIFFLGVLSIRFCQAQHFEWASQIGGTSQDAGQSVVVDDAGNVYMTGRFKGTVDFDPGPDTLSLTSAGNFDIFITKQDAAGQLLWAKQLGSTEEDRGQDIAVDATGNVYITGRFRLTVDFDPGPGTATQSSAGSSDMFISKLDSAGNYVWAKRIGGAGEDRCQTIALDGSGNIHLAGRFQQTVDFDPGTGTFNLNSVSSNDIFVSKFDAFGGFLWAKSMGNMGSDVANSLALDAMGNVITTGFFTGPIDFNPGSGSFVLTGNFNDVFIQKLDPNGNFVWARKLGGFGFNEGHDVAVDDWGNVLTTGRFTGTVDFDPGAGTFNLNSVGSEDIFVSKLDPSGNFVWAKRIGGAQVDRGHSIATDTLGNVYTTGRFKATVDFDPGVSTFALQASGGYDAFLCKLDAAGNFEWATKTGGQGDDIGRELFADDADQIYLTGYFHNAADFDPGQNTAVLVSAGISDIYIQKLTDCHSYFSRTEVVTACDEFTWIDGNTYRSSNNAAAFTKPNASGCDSTIYLDLTITSSHTVTDVITACDSFTWINGITYTEDNNSASVTLTNASGCDSVINLDLTIINFVNVTEVITACDSFTWRDGITYTASNNTATDTLFHALTCDSVITLDLTIMPSTTATDVITACYEYTWIDGNTYTANNNTATYVLSNASGCDSVVTLDLTVTDFVNVTEVITACGSYTWRDGITYASNNNSATFTVTDPAGCDSILTLDLTVNQVDTGITLAGTTLTASAVSGSYQWLDCANGFTRIPGETAQNFTPTQNGTYAVEVTENACADTSDCITISTVSLEEERLFKGVSVYPNPNQGKVSVDLDGLKDVSVTVFNAFGQMIYQQERIHDPILRIEWDGPSGVYFLKVASGEKSRSFTMVKE